MTVCALLHVKVRSMSSTSQPKPQIGLILTSVFLIYLAQMTLNPVIAPLSRELGLPEWQIGVMISTAALMIVLSSQFWGRKSQSWGRKPVLTVAMVVGAAALALFALFATFGTQGLVTGTTLFALLVLFRGLIFGSAIAAVLPTAQTYIANVTETETERVRGMAGLGAVQGMSMIAGAVVGGLLASFGLITAVAVLPLFVLAGLASVLMLRKEPASDLIAKPARVSPADSRVWPFLVAGFGMFMGLGFIQIVSGFLVQDRFSLTPENTGLVTGGVLLSAGIGMLIAQLIVVPRSGWNPVKLLRVGIAVAALGFVLLIPHAPMFVVFVAVLLIGFGIGLASPGYTAGPTLLMSREEQGGLAGLIGANTALTFVFAPTLSTLLYGVHAELPILVGGVLLVLVFLFVLLHPRFRQRVRGQELSG